MIKKLTSEQEAQLPVFRDEMLRVACGGSRIDRDKLQTALNDAYALIDKEPPLLIIMQSPMQAQLAINFLMDLGEITLDLKDQLRSQLRSQLWSQLGSQLRSQLGSQLWSQLRSQLGSQLRSQLWSQLRSQLGSQLESQLGSQLWSQLGSQLRSQLGSQLGSQLESQLGTKFQYTGLWGCHDLYWIGFYKFCNDIGVNYTDAEKNILDINYRIASQCEWWWPYDGVVIVSEKPIEVNWDGAVLHGENKPAVLYEDGYGIYSWRGTNVPAEWIENKESVTPEIALTWKNVEQRRCAAEIVGWHNILEHPSLKPKIIDTDSDPQIGTLIEVTLPDIGTERFLKVQCGTGRTFALPVPPDSKTALAANAWTYGLEPQDYTPEIRT